MDLEMFQNSPTGHLVPISGGSEARSWVHRAFVPHPLTGEEPALDASTYRRVAAARASLAALDATSARLPNPRLFRHATVRIEAQSTSAIEGTYEPLARVFADEPARGQDPSLREVLNYVTVAETAFESMEQGVPWSVEWLNGLHRILMEGTAGERSYFGVRPVQVVIGLRHGVPIDAPPIATARFVPPPPGELLESGVTTLLEWLQSDHGQIDPVVAAAMGHYVFEALHPFHDGNGRLGRLFMVMHLQHLGVLTEPTITVSPWFDGRREAYYDALLGVSSTGDWSTWVSLFAEGLAASADQTRHRMLALSEVQARLQERIRSGGIRTASALRLVDFAVARPTFTVAQAAEALSMQPPGTRRLVERLMELGVLGEYGQRSYNRRYHAPEVLDVLMSKAW